VVLSGARLPEGAAVVVVFFCSCWGFLRVIVMCPNKLGMRAVCPAVKERAA
jgi:hypothetical protein